MTFIEQGGVDTSLICWKKTDGIGRLCRNGLNFTERGFGIRGAKGCSDRANTAISQATPEDFDFDYIFKNKSDGGLGVRWLQVVSMLLFLNRLVKLLLQLVRQLRSTVQSYLTILTTDHLWEANMV